MSAADSSTPQSEALNDLTSLSKAELVDIIQHLAGVIDTASEIVTERLLLRRMDTLRWAITTGGGDEDGDYTPEECFMKVWRELAALDGLLDGADSEPKVPFLFLIASNKDHGHAKHLEDVQQVRIEDTIV